MPPPGGPEDPSSPGPISCTQQEKEERVNNLLRLIGRRLIALPIMAFGVTILVFFLKIGRAHV